MRCHCSRVRGVLGIVASALAQGQRPDIGIWKLVNICRLLEYQQVMAAAEFRALPAEPISEEGWDTPCLLGPDDLLAGCLENGMRLAATLCNCDIHLLPPHLPP